MSKTMHVPQADLLIVDYSVSSNEELDQLHQEAEEYDFLLDRTPKELPEYWEEEE